MYQGLAKTRYVNDKQITDHYAIIPTGQGFGSLKGLSTLSANVYELIVRRFLSIFFPPAVYEKITLTSIVKSERFFTSFKIQTQEGYLRAASLSFLKKKRPEQTKNSQEIQEDGIEQGTELADAVFLEMLPRLKKGTELVFQGEEPYSMKEGETTPPKRYHSGTLILTMENAGQFIEEEELRAQIKGSGIGTSATRAEILKKLVNIGYLSLNKKTQVITPTLMGEMIYEIVDYSIRPLLNPALTASWEKGLTQVADGRITSQEYMAKLDDFVSRRTNLIKGADSGRVLYGKYENAAKYYTRK